MAEDLASYLKHHYPDGTGQEQGDQVRMAFAAATYAAMLNVVQAGHTMKADGIKAYITSILEEAEKAMQEFTMFQKRN
jgi:hypothetical protein